MNIEHVDTKTKGYFRAIEDELEAGLMTYTWANENLFIIDHTEVASEFSGQGVGKKMVMAAVEFARSKEIKILPLCPFAKSVFNKTPEIQDVLR